MIWVMLYYLLSGSPSGLVYDISDPVEQYVAVKETAKQIISINKEMLQEEAKQVEVNTKAKTLLAAINANRLATESDIKAVLTEVEKQRIVARNRIIEMRFGMRDLMSAEEWRNVYAAASQHE